MSEEPAAAQLERELAYYLRRVDELAGEHLKLEYEISGLRHQLNQKQQGFALLSELQQSIGGHKHVSSIFEAAMHPIDSTLGMDKTVILVPTEDENVYRPSQWLGFREQLVERFRSATFAFPAELAHGSGLLLVNASTEPTELVERIRELFELPYFVCLPVLVEDEAIALILSGRAKEARPLYPPLDHGDVDTFQAIAGLISASVHGMRIAILEEMDRLKTEFFANISHELRTPITLTLGPLEQLLGGRLGALPERVLEQLRVMLRNQQRLLVLINQILDLAKLEAGEMQLSFAPLPQVNRFVEERASPFRALAAERGIDLQLALDERLEGAALFVDRENFDRLIVNLLSNATKFTKAGSVRVSTELQGSTFRLTVEDTGIGIRPDDLPNVFDRFRQGDGGLSREYAGTGIGLALVKEIAVLHGGDVSVRSEYGKGSAFRVSIPLGKAHLNPASIVELTGEERPGGTLSDLVVLVEGASGDEGVREANDAAGAAFDPTRQTVIYAEDNIDLRNHVLRLLEPSYNVFVAADGGSALELARKRRPDLVLTDYMMPRVSGRELLAEIRADPELRATPVILLTARAGTEARIESLEAGADDYLAKPFDEAELLARIRSLLRIKEYQDEIRAQAAELAQWSRTLEQRVEQQVEELERSGRLRRFLSPQVAEAIVSAGEDTALQSHRREIAVVFCDLRGFTAFSESTEPETLMRVLDEYHRAMGEIVFKYEGTLEHFEGDGFCVFFNDPVPCPDPVQRAVRMAAEMRDRARDLGEGWERRGYLLGFGVGIAFGYATLGKIGFEGRYDYAAIGSVVNLAARLADEARSGQILLSPQAHVEVEDLVETERVGALALKGFREPVGAWNVVSIRAGSAPDPCPEATVGIPLAGVGETADREPALGHPAD